jgi:hypothetical protein
MIYISPLKTIFPYFVALVNFNFVIWTDRIGSGGNFLNNVQGEVLTIFLPLGSDRAKSRV